MAKDDAPIDPQSESSFFSYYGTLVNQQNMLQDAKRTSTYHDAITSNKIDFTGKVVLDFGAGTGILSFFAAKAGAARVYAIEGSDMAHNARKLIEGNGLGHIITVVQGKGEEVELPEKVDVIVSEPMGVLLVHERAMESLIVARDKFLKPSPNGEWLPSQMFPSRSVVYLAPFTDIALYAETIGRVSFWKTRDFYGVDLSPLYEDARKSQFMQIVVGPIDPRSILSSPVTHDFEFTKMNVEEFKNFKVNLHFVVSSTGLMHGIAGWFDVLFLGSECTKQLACGPADEVTHWYQCRFVLDQPVAVNQGQVITGSLALFANSQRSHDVHLTLHLEGSDIKVDQKYALHDQLYWNLEGVPSQKKSKEELGIYGEGK